MPNYTVTINHIYEEIEEIQVEADDEMEAHDKAEALAEPNNAWDHAQHTAMQVLNIEKEES